MTSDLFFTTNLSPTSIDANVRLSVEGKSLSVELLPKCLHEKTMQEGEEKHLKFK